ncbi:MAG: class I SAM-dependent methyltransferase [Ignavibacteria bacterium]|nr:class I SAM-dependent methyltransferase [Ignavibacteria bacterium]
MEKKNWYEKWFSNKYYLELYRHRNEKEARDIINLMQRFVPLPVNSKVLDVCCGAGRHSIELARRGYDVTGIDLSPYLISEAKSGLKKSDEKNLKARFFIKDMRNFSFKNRFDIVLNVFSSFGYFEKDAENFKVFENVTSSLKKDGYFIFDFLNESYIKKSLVPYSEDKCEGNTIIQKRKIENGFVYKEIFIGNSKYNERIRLYTLTEIQKALKSVNLKTENIFGDYFGSKFNKLNSKRLIIFSRLV